MVFLKNVAEAEKRLYVASFKENLPLIERELSIDQREIADMDAQAAQFLQDIDDVNRQELAFSAAIQKRNDNRNVFIPLFNKFLKRCQTANRYTKSFGELSGIVKDTKSKTSRGTGIDITNSKDFQVKIVTSGQKVSFKFKKQRTVSVIIYCRRESEDSFSFVKQVSGNGYDDFRANLNGSNAEQRFYCFALTKNDVEGDKSAVYSVAVG